ncbi:MAG TPA: S4 domain-containing protein, partial [Chloroflexia bacterium]|nr:S4 domain-containing protein [Chloroflexia bacterium]
MTHTPQGQSRLVEWQVGASEAGERLDRAITAHLSHFSRSYVATLIEAGAVTLNGQVASKPGQKLRAGDHI